MKNFIIVIFYSFYLLIPLTVFISWKIYTQKKKSIELIILLIILLVLLWSRFVETNALRIKKYNFSVNSVQEQENIEKNNSEKLKVVVLSDIHAGIFTSKITIRRIVKKINNLDPDLVLIVGDFVYYAKKQELNKYLGELKNIETPTLAVLGNHDYGKGDKNLSRDISSVLESAGILMLDNDIKELKINNKNITIAGLADIWTAQPDYNVLNLLSGEQDLSLLLAHNPDTAYEIIEKNPEAPKFDLMLSGHTHAGQIRIPLLYKHIIPTIHPFDKGFYNISGQNVFVTAGIGSSGMPMRLFNFPEISVIDIDF